MSTENNNKTMLVAVSNQTDNLTNFNQPTEAYSNFRNTAISNTKYKNNLYNGTNNTFLLLSFNIFKQINTLQNSYDIGEHQDIRGALVESINHFTESANQKDIDNALLARYILCAFSDEIICTTYWGKDNNWANSSLLGHFYNETYGGDKFFQILEQLLRAPAKYVDLLELIYICLSLGFEGKYRIQNRGKMELDSIREGLFRQLKMMGIRDTTNFYSSQKVSSNRNNVIYKTSYQILAISIVVMLSLAYGVLTFSLVSKENRTQELLQAQYKKYKKAELTNYRTLIKSHTNQILQKDFYNEF